MPTANWGDKQSFSASKFTKLKSKGDKIQFKILGGYVFGGKHFMGDKKNGKWEGEVVDCSRINEGAECEICNNFFAAHRSAKKENLNKAETEKLVNPFKPSISYYFPVLNRVTEQFEVFQTTPGVKNQIDAKLELNPKVLERDLIVMRTEIPGSYYSLDVVDSSETKDLTKKEKAEAKKGADANLEDYVNGTSKDKKKDEVDF